MAEGASITECAAEIRVSKQTIYNWAEEHPEFLDSLNEGRALCEAWWERQGRENLKDKDFNHVLWYMNMKNRHGWRDKHEHTGADGGPIGLIIERPSRSDDASDE
jgi:hypothetical protein